MKHIKELLVLYIVISLVLLPVSVAEGYSKEKIIVYATQNWTPDGTVPSSTHGKNPWAVWGYYW